MPASWGGLLLGVVLSCSAAADNGSYNDLDARQWREDLELLREQMPRSHGNLFHTMTRAQFDGALDDLEASLPAATTSQVKVGILRLVAMVNDGHTRVRQESLGNHILPVRIHFFADGLYVVAAEQAHADIVGGRVRKIGVMSADEVYAAVRTLVSIDADNEGRRRYLAVDLIMMSEVLQAIGASASAVAVDLVVEKDGRERLARLSGRQSGSWADRPWPMTPDGWVDAAGHAANPRPLWLQHPDSPYWHAFVDNGRTLYIQYNKVADDPGGEPIETWFPRLFAQAQRRGTDRVIIDLRLNGGGNNELNRPIWHALLRSDRLNQKGRLWIAIGSKTFSAAMNFVDDLETNTNATFVGEPTGETPNMWGDPVRITLPNSGIVVQTSTLWWQHDPRDRRPFRAPDLPAAVTFADYSNNIDPLDAVIPKRRQ